MEDRELAAYWNGPMGLLRVLIGIVVSEAVEGGMTEARADELYKELCKQIEKQEGRLCSCGDCQNKLSIESVAAHILDKMRGVLSQYHSQYE